MEDVVLQCRRILKPKGSAVFILQPNHEKVGKMRLWLWRFLLWAAEEWGLIQDCYWWSPNSLPTCCANRRYGLLRQSVKMCIWLGNPDCYRNQENVLWRESDSTAALNWEDRCLRHVPGGQTFRPGRIAETVAERGGTTPFNLIPISTAKIENNGGHPACTPSDLASWWCRYILPENGVLLDPFVGSGSILASGLSHARKVIGIDKSKQYLAIAKKRIGES